MSLKLPIITKPSKQTADNANIEERKKEFGKKNVTKNNEPTDKGGKIKIEDSGFDSDDVTEQEFEITLDVIMTCEYLSDNLTKHEMIAFVNNELNEEDDDETNLKEVIFDTLLERKPNRRQFVAFLDDIQSMFIEQRDLQNMKQGTTVEIDIDNVHLDLLAVAEKTTLKRMKININHQIT